MVETKTLSNSGVATHYLEELMFDLASQFLVVTKHYDFICTVNMYFEDIQVYLLVSQLLKNIYKSSRNVHVFIYVI